MKNEKFVPMMGWVPDLPDNRDITIEDDKRKFEDDSSLSELLSGIDFDSGVGQSKNLKLLRWFDQIQIEDQEDIGSCTANAGVSLLEYFEKRFKGKYTDASRLFLYKATRNLMHLTGDTGASMRATMKAMRLFGVPPEEYWPYETTRYDDEPTAFCYAYAQSYQALKYYRLDPLGIPPNRLLDRIKKQIIKGLPPMFGFTVFRSYTQGNNDGKIPFPSAADRVVGGHAILAIGFDDNVEICNMAPGSTPTKGAIYFRNSWGIDWGDEGNGWLPYEYVLQNLTRDWWSLLKKEYLNSDEFS